MESTPENRDGTVEVSVSLNGDFPITFKRGAFSDQFRIHSTAVVCPQCLRVWCVMQVPDESSYELQSRSCAECAFRWAMDDWSVPGSLIDNPVKFDRLDWDLLEYLPESLLRREFELTLRALQ